MRRVMSLLGFWGLLTFGEIAWALLGYVFSVFQGMGLARGYRGLLGNPIALKDGVLFSTTYSFA